MTKSGIGTGSGSNTTQSSLGSTPVQSQSNTITSNQAQTTSVSIANAEIPIWIADRKKWVTGISKKTTINDLIYAILKQCQLINNSLNNEMSTSSQLEQIANQYVLIEYQLEPTQQQQQQPQINNDSSTEQSQLAITSQRILNGDTKVYKYLNKWSQTPNTILNNNIMLKILQRQTENSDLNEKEANNMINNNNNNSSNLNQQHSSTSLATKLLKKFGVSSNSTSSNSNNNQAQTSNNNNTNTNSTPSSKPLTNSISLNSNLNNATFRYVDVKLPQLNQSQSQNGLLNSNNANNNKLQHPQQPIQSLSPCSNTTASSSSTLNQRVFDPNLQKSFLFNSIIERESKLKQQNERCQLLDELIKETEKKSKNANTNNILNSLSINNINTNTNLLNNPTYNYSPLSSVSASASNSSSPNSTNNKNINNSSTETNLFKSSSTNQLQNNVNSNTTTHNNINNSNNKQQMNIVDLNDIYCHFPEMCTHHLQEVEDFTLMCCQLFQLEETIKNQKQILSNLEHDLQRELNQNQTNCYLPAQTQHQQAAPTSPIPQSTSSANETPETIELRKEVNQSREKTRMQCKQLHDLDLCMRQNEQSLMAKEQQLQQLLEELYIQEIYADNALETAITNTASNSSNKHQHQSKVSPYSPSVIVNQFVDSNSHKDQINLEDEPSNILINEDVNEFENENDENQLKIQLMHQQQQAIELKINNEPKIMMMKNENNDQVKRHQQSQQIPIINSFNDDISFNLQPHHHAQQFRQPSYKNLMHNSGNNNTNSSVNLTSSSMYPLNKITSNNNLMNNQFNLNQNLNVQQKSLSIGNLASNSVNLNSKIILTNSPVNHQNLSINSNPNMLKASPSLDLNSKQTKLQNGINANGTNVINSDHSGDNDSGISSMSSETTTMTTTTTTNSSSSSTSSTSSAMPNNNNITNTSSIPINFVQSVKPQSMHNINNNYNQLQIQQIQQYQQRQQQMYINNNNVNPMLINNMQNQQQYQYQLQHQQQQQLNAANSTNKPTKSVLETLV